METRVTMLSTALMGDQSARNVKKHNTQKNNEYPSSKYNNKYLNMTSICAKKKKKSDSIEWENIFKTLLHSLHHHLLKANRGRAATTTVVGLKCVQCSPVTCCWDDADTTEAKASWKRQWFSLWPMPIVMHVFRDLFSPELEHAFVRRWCIYIYIFKKKHSVTLTWQI